MTEIDALKTMDELLAGLDDNATRDRVLRWACQKYAVSDPRPSISAGHRVEASPPTSKPPATAKGKSRPRTSTSTSPSLVRDLNLKPKGREPFDKFAAKKSPSSNQYKCVVATYYLRHELNLSQITVDHVYTCFKCMHWRVPANLTNTLAYVASVDGWLDTRSMADIRLTTMGENLVEHDLPKPSKGAED